MIKEQKIVNKTKQSEFKQNKFYIIINYYSIFFYQGSGS